MVEPTAEVMRKSWPVVIIAPDVAAGKDFLQSFASRGFKAELHQADIAPRVVQRESGDNVMTEEVETVAGQLARAIASTLVDKGGWVTIACNTLSLPQPFVERALAILREEMNIEPDADFRLVTTLDALWEKYARSSPPLFLGTTVTSRELPKHGFPTLAEGPQKNEELLNLVQEVIWRVKKVEGSDVASAPQHPEFADVDQLRSKVAKLVDGLRKKGFNEVILGCTELPIAFGKYAPDQINLNLINPADVVAKYILQQSGNDGR